MSDELRNSLWNLFYSLYDNSNWEYWKPVATHVARFFRKVPVDELPYRNNDCRKWLKEYFFAVEWYEAYDLVEFLAVNHQHMTCIPIGTYDAHRHAVNNERLLKAMNTILEQELSGYRFISGVLSPIATPVEVETIEDATNAAVSKGFQGAHEHLRAALRLLGKKPDPDYRNSIKESISAVESVAKLISGEEGGGLDVALTSLSNTAGIHGALRSGFLKLYGYSSDEDGIRTCYIGTVECRLCRGEVHARSMLSLCQLPHKQS
ncbi:MAG: hypothetical protein M3436_05780 [Pseudomonadota bacterium]|nr:hypothetical protein [Pseudomonadota bacterium]